ncbi:MAG TPA: lipid IV(A) palmitoyltransferase PagP, partial [Enterobacteriaceae bacterium]|nr:lipid IV(A) palmitoyltransferase PagP [Enterobacteriaceae bacterium]
MLAKKFLAVLLLISGTLTLSATAADKGWFSTLTDNVAETWNAPQHYDLYVPA